MPERSLVVTVLRASPESHCLTATAAAAQECLSESAVGGGDGCSASVDVVARVDMDGSGRAATAEVVDRVARLCVQRRAVSAIALIVDDRATVPGRRHRGVRSRQHGNLIAALEHRLDAEGVPLAGAWAVREIGAEQEWWSVAGQARRGVQPDPAASLVTVRQVLEGRPMRGSRDELTGLVAVDAELRERVSSRLERAGADAAERLAGALRCGDPELFTRGALRCVMEGIGAVGAGALLGPDELAEVAVALRDPAVRDIMFALTEDPHAQAAEALWLQLTRALPDEDRADAAALLAYHAYARGDGPLAGVALEVALGCDPAHRVAMLLDMGLQSGMRPSRLHRLAESGREAAAELGVNLATCFDRKQP
ncbi:DUF4192 domain-containing protein [Nocardia yamanashiensis]|uniref:DUF4192 domain-containing protein n=1 Tax=Nocardia yamanashiensis TaxID=209247 RepID=UPI001E2DD153|nr:DUF4192 domain-containing protein [Nocardia yamanashiensis]UGT42524.1 DUF4192 domain-containing protein [Nocardia yamanashiensis]